MFGIKLNPVNQKRLQRFKQMKRARFAFWGLVGIYCLSLCSELICNSNPYIVRYEGKTYFPFLAAYNGKLPFVKHVGMYPEDDFLKNGVLTPPDYKWLARNKVFKDNPSNYMIFSPIPYGDVEVVDLEQLSIPKEVNVDFERIGQVASIDLRNDLTIRKATNSMAFSADIGSDNDAKDKPFIDFWPITSALKQAIEQRFANTAAPEMTATVVGKDEKSIVVRLREWKPRSRPPTKIRLRLEEAIPAESKTVHMAFFENLKVKKTAPLWDEMKEADQKEVRELVKQRVATTVVPRNMSINGLSYLVKLDKVDRKFPFEPVWANRHFMGLDDRGRDVLVRILYAARIGLNFGIILVLVSYTVGIFVGACQGYFAGLVDIGGQRFIEIWGTIPFLYVVIFLGNVFGKSFGLLLMIYALFNWIGISYYMRAEFLRLRKSTFVESAKCLGIPSWKIIVRHILPNATVPIITFFPFALVGAIGSLNALDYLGYGLPPPTPSWGELLGQAQAQPGAWWLIVFPFLALFTTILLCVFIGEGVRAAFDPKATSRLE